MIFNIRNSIFLSIALLLLCILACSKSSDTPVDIPEPKPEPEEDTRSMREKYSTTPGNWPKAVWLDGVSSRELASLPDNPNEGKTSHEMITLGKALFFDSRLGNGLKSCASCHNPETYWIDQSKTASGITDNHHRNTPTMENVWFLEGNLFHDGRAKTYREQIAEAIESPIEMGGNTQTLAAKLQVIPGYVSLYEAAYGTTQLTRAGLLDAIADYSKSISSGETAFDRFVRGEYTALTDQQIEGMHLFRTKGKCINCHNGPFFTDMRYHNLGYAVDFRGDLDNGRYEATGLEADKGKFRTPGLRNVANTAPYWHNGEIATLAQVVDLLNKGMPHTGRQKINGTLSPHIKPLQLTSNEQRDILAFLNALSSAKPDIERPDMPQ